MSGTSSKTSSFKSPANSGVSRCEGQATPRQYTAHQCPGLRYLSQPTRPPFLCINNKPGARFTQSGAVLHKGEIIFPCLTNAFQKPPGFFALSEEGHRNAG